MQSNFNNELRVAWQSQHLIRQTGSSIQGPPGAPVQETRSYAATARLLTLVKPAETLARD